VTQSDRDGRHGAASVVGGAADGTSGSRCPAPFSIETAREFTWGSVTGDLHPERVAHLRSYLVGKDVLDAGCGGGGFVDFLTRQGFCVTGIELEQALLQNARENRRTGRFAQADVTALPFPDRSFDSTYCFDVLEHVDDVAAIAELARVTRRRLILAVPRKDEEMTRFGLTFATYRDTTHLRYYTTADLDRLLRSIPHRHVSIVPELFVPFRQLVEWTIRQGFERPESRTLWSRALAKLHRDVSCAVARRLLDMANAQRRVPSGLVGIVELDAADR